MESFFRYISYVDFYDNHNKIKNVGFLRWKYQGGKHNIELQIKDANNLYGNFKIEEKKTGKIVGDMKLDQGIGSYIKQFPAVTVFEDVYLNTEYDQICINDIEGFYIWLKDGNYIFVPIDLPIEKRNRQQSVNDAVNSSEIESASENVLIEGIEEKYVEESRSAAQNGIEERKIPAQRYVEESRSAAQNGIEERKIPVQRYVEDRRNSVQNGIEEREIPMQRYVEDRQSPIRKEAEERAIPTQKYVAARQKVEEFSRQKHLEKLEEDNIKILEPLHEDKWQQLSKKYPIVHPFSNKIAYLSIKPEDFIILQKGYQKLVNNSFLLHGFYNYGHLILGKLVEDEAAPLYLGVPGVYYDREKQAAQMFGFVGFESTQQPVQAGSYGYYMIEVMI